MMISLADYMAASVPVRAGRAPYVSMWGIHVRPLSTLVADPCLLSVPAFEGGREAPIALDQSRGRLQAAALPR